MKFEKKMKNPNSKIFFDELHAKLTFDPTPIKTYTCDPSPESTFHGLQQYAISFVVALFNTEILSILCGKVQQNVYKESH